MTRDIRCSRAYWDKWTAYQFDNVHGRTEESRKPAGDPSYAPQYLFNLAKEYWHLIFYRYSRGDPIDALSSHFPPLLEAWEEAERLGKEIWTEEQQITRHAWSTNLSLREG